MNDGFIISHLRDGGKMLMEVKMMQELLHQKVYFIKNFF